MIDEMFMVGLFEQRSRKEEFQICNFLNGTMKIMWMKEIVLLLGKGERIIV